VEEVIIAAENVKLLMVVPSSLVRFTSVRSRLKLGNLIRIILIERLVLLIRYCVENVVVKIGQE
jgi:hypothetical protein